MKGERKSKREWDKKGRKKRRKQEREGERVGRKKEDRGGKGAVEEREGRLSAARVNF